MQSEPAKKKEKPLLKTPIPGTEWLRVRTTEGNVFYSHKAKKESVWMVPDEIKEAVEKLEKEESKKQEKTANAPADGASKAELERAMEVQRIKEEVQAMVKRKAEDSVPLDEVVIAKKAKVEEEEDEGDESDESEEEEWQREAAAQLAAEAEAEIIRQEAEAVRLKEAEAEAKRAQLNMPERVDLSIEEAKALFKVRSLLSPIFLPVKHSALAYTDSLERKRYQSIASLGYFASEVCIRPSVCSSTIGFGTA